MADESLGHIEIRFPEGEAGGATADNSEIVAVMRDLVATLKKGIGETEKEVKEERKPKEKKELTDFQKINGTIEKLKEVFRGAGYAAGSGSISGVGDAAKTGVEAISTLLEGFGEIAVAVGIIVVAIVVALAIMVATVVLIWKVVMAGVQEVLQSIDRLANVSGAMAMEKALNTLQQMQMDIKEAQILGPIYSEISGLYRRLQAVLFPFIMLFKTFIFGILKWILEKIVSLLELIREAILTVLRFAIGITSALATGGQFASNVGGALASPMGATIMGPSSYILGWILQATGSGVNQTFIAATEILTKIYDLMNASVKTTAHPNDYFNQMLAAMSTSKNAYR